MAVSVSMQTPIPDYGNFGANISNSIQQERNRQSQEEMNTERINSNERMHKIDTKMKAGIALGSFSKVGLGEMGFTSAALSNLDGEYKKMVASGASPSEISKAIVDPYLTLQGRASQIAEPDFVSGREGETLLMQDALKTAYNVPRDYKARQEAAYKRFADTSGLDKAGSYWGSWANLLPNMINPMSNPDYYGPEGFINNEFFSEDYRNLDYFEGMGLDFSNMDQAERERVAQAYEKSRSNIYSDWWNYEGTGTDLSVYERERRRLWDALNPAPTGQDRVDAFHGALPGGADYDPQFMTTPYANIITALQDDNYNKLLSRMNSEQPGYNLQNMVPYDPYGGGYVNQWANPVNPTGGR